LSAVDHVELIQLVVELEHEARRARQLLLADRISQLFPYVDVDDVLAERARGATRDKLGLSLPQAAAPTHKPGETWVLLHDDVGGCVERLRLDDPGADRFTSERFMVYRGLYASLAQMGHSLGNATRVWPFSITGVPLATVDGASWGLAYAVALVSHAVNGSPSPRVVGSAQVLDDGKLGVVKHLSAKLSALARYRSWVRHVVVAYEQTLESDPPAGLEIVRAHTVGEAVAHFALGPIPPAPVEEFQRRILGYEAQNAKNLPAEEWLALAADALAAVDVCGEDRPDLAAKGRAWAALFALHGGEPRLAEHLVEDLTTDLPELNVFQRIVRATTEIDRESFDDAIQHAREAVLAAEKADPATRKNQLGPALGTLGRAYVHAGRPAEGEAPLRKAVAHFEQHAPLEAPRTKNYLATCLRVSGRATEALAVVNEALQRLESRTRPSDLAVATMRYLSLERARVLLALHRPGESIVLLDRLLGPDRWREESYPELGALQTLAIALRSAGQEERAEAILDRCLTIAEKCRSQMLARVAAIAAGDALERGAPGRLGARCTRVWSLAFPGEGGPEQRRRRLGTWVY
jgi:tetratricopeptide (TPR) repeat protein